MRKVEVTTNINAAPATVIQAFTDADMLRDWWGVERVLIDSQPGGLYTLAWSISESGLGFVSTGVIREFVSDRTLVVDNLVYLRPDKPFLGPMTLIVKTLQNGDTTTLYICQDGYQRGPDWDWYYDAVSEAWPAVVQKLKDYLEQRP